MIKNTLLKLFLTFLVISSFSLDLNAKKRKQYFNEASFEVDFEITHQIIPLEIDGTGNKEIVIVGVENNANGTDKSNNVIIAVYQKAKSGLSYELFNKINLP
ncbi:MAG: hypothetical protein ACPGJI_07355, partial [Kangiellaceae bacterium]